MAPICRGTQPLGYCLDKPLILYRWDFFPTGNVVNGFQERYWWLTRCFQQGPAPLPLVPPLGRAASDGADVRGRRSAPRLCCRPLLFSHLAHAEWVHHHPGDGAGQRSRALTPTRRSAPCHSIQECLRRIKYSSFHLWEKDERLETLELWLSARGRTVNLDEVTGNLSSKHLSLLTDVNVLNTVLASGNSLLFLCLFTLWNSVSPRRNGESSYLTSREYFERLSSSALPDPRTQNSNCPLTPELLALEF